MVYTVKQLADLAGVSNRTLHYYDEIGLLKPSSYSDSGYRYYDEEALLRLQQILFLRELDISLQKIGTILEQPDYDLVQALTNQRQALAQRAKRLENLMHTIDKTIQHLQGELEMSSQEFFGGFSEEQQKEYE
ncbi:MAG: MerR family transcriptional regulator, partial [Anaerolineales bacterium]|nr:MerR family transcriptional regulator [Anaerolineales bacterium]